MRRFTEREQRQIAALYADGHSSMALAKRFNTHDTTIRYQVRRAGGECRALSSAWALRPRLYACNEQFFSAIDNERAAYWLGFMYADGSVVKRRDRPSNQMTVNLGAKDREHLLLFRKHLRASQPVFMTGRGTPMLSVTSRVLTDDLIRHGCGHRKTHRLRFPKIRPDLLNHFMRGYFDGDGCISITHGPTVSIVGHRQFITEFQRRLMQNCSLSITAVRELPNTRCVSISHGGRFKVRRIRTFFYRGATVFLARKRDKFMRL